MYHSSCRLASWLLALLPLVPPTAGAQEVGPAPAAVGPACTESRNAHRIRLDQSYVQGEVRAFYTRKGPHALYTLEDLNHNGVPDMVEDTVTYVHAVRIALNRNGYQDPLQSARFAGARYIDIDFLNLPAPNGSRIGNRALAFSRVLRFASRGDACAISIAIHSQSPRNHEHIKDFLIPHEMFHLYQYGHTMFRQSWALEGMASWAAWVLKTENARDPLLWSTPLPHDADSLRRQVLESPNPRDARLFWNRLAELVMQHEPPPSYPQELDGLRFANGSPVLRDRIWRGHAFMRKLLEEMREQEQRLGKSLGRGSPLTWTDAEQRSPHNDPWVIEAVQRTLARYRLPNEEVLRFLAIPSGTDIQTRESKVPVP